MAEMSNPFFRASALPYGIPPFRVIQEQHYRPAFERGFAEQAEEVRRIAEQAEEPSFENTVLALERSGQLLARVQAVFENASSADSSPFTTSLEEELAPRLAAHLDAILLNRTLYRRIATLYEHRRELGLDQQSLYLVERYYLEFSRAGAALDDASRVRLRELNARLSSLQARFEKNLLADTAELALRVDDATELEGLSEAEISAARRSAEDRGLCDGYLIPLVLPTGHPYLSRLSSRTLRERIMAASRSRGTRGGAHDNRSTVLEIAAARAERARVLGFPDHASLVTADETIGSAQAVDDLLTRLAGPARRAAAAEKLELCRAAGADQLAASDWPFYAERVRRDRFHVDSAELRSYFEAGRVLRDGVFFAAAQLYGVSFLPRDDLPGYHPDVQVFEAADHDGSRLGLYLLDLYARDSKRGGAWMNPLVSQSELLGNTAAVVVNNLNVPRPAAGQPTLLTFDEVCTLFHEFGHALHGLFARVRYPKFAGTNVFRDFVEFPSQVNEMWALWPEVLAHYAKHYRTGEPMPDQLASSLASSRRSNEGFKTAEYLAAALLDQAWHRLGAGDEPDDVSEFEARALARAGLDDPAIPPRYSSTYFAHAFSGGYDAGYYAYIWSEVLDADTVEWFRENGGLTRENGDRFRQALLAIGGSRDPLQAYREFRGRDASIDPLLERRGLAG